MPSKFEEYTVFILIILGLVFLGIGCAEKNGANPFHDQNNSSGAAPAPQSQDIFLKGSDTVLPLAQAEAEEFMNENPNKSVTVTGGGTGVGIAALIDGEVDIATASREMKTDEIKAAKAKGINPKKYTIAYDGVAIIVNPRNPVSELTFEQLRGIYNGSISNWKDVNGDNRPVAVIARDSSSGTYQDFKNDVLQGDEYRPDALTQPATGGVVSEVSQNPNAIGYIGIAYVNNDVKVLSLNKGNGSVSPSAESILSGAYPLSRSLYFYTKGEPSGLTKEFIDFVISKKGQNLVREVKYIPLKE